MSGPVWRVEKGVEIVCSECLRTTDGAVAEGELRDGRFETNRVLCKDCYKEHARLILKWPS